MPLDPIYGAVEVLTPAEQQARGLRPSPPPGPLTPPPTPSPTAPRPPLLSSPQGFYGPGLLANIEARRTGVTPGQAYAQRVPQLEQTANVLGALLAPGKTLATRLAGQASVAGGLEALKGGGPLNPVKAGLGAAAGQLAGTGLLKGAGRALSATRLPAVEQGVEHALTSKLQSAVPAWANLSTVKAMFFSQTGWNTLHTAFDTALKAVVKKGENRVIQVTQQDAKTLGVKDWIAPKDPTVDTVGLNAAEAAKAVVGLWTKHPGTYRRVTAALDDAGVGDPAARKAYKTAIGLRAYFMKQGAIRSDGSLDLLKAQAGLVKGKSVDELLRRGLGEFDQLMRPGGKAIQQGSLAGPLGAAGAGLGALGGHQFGLVPVGSLFGAYHGARLGSRIPTYSNLPPGPLLRVLQAVGPRLAASAGGQLGPGF